MPLLGKSNTFNNQGMRMDLKQINAEEYYLNGTQIPLSSAEFGIIDGVTNGTAQASKVLTSDANLDTSGIRNLGMTGTLTFGVGGQVNADSGTGTAVTSAVTISKMAGVITSEALTTAAGAAATITVTNTTVAAADMIFLTRIGGTSAAGTPIFKAVPGSGSFVITIDNKHASAAFDGTFIIAFLVVKA